MMRKWISLFLLGIAGAIIACGVVSFLFFLILAPIFSIDGKHTYTLDEIGQAVNSPIPTDATNTVYSSETRYGYFIKLSFTSPPDSALTFAKQICGALYQRYDPFTATDSSASKRNYFLIKWAGYAYFSHSISSQTIYGNRCQLKSRPFSPIQITVDQTNPKLFQVHFELLESSCSLHFTCSPYSVENSAHHPLPRNSPVPLIAYGFEDNRDVYRLKGNELCVETNPGLFYSWDKPPFSLNDLKGASFELFVDAQSKGQAAISDNGQLKVDYSTGNYIGLHESPEYCFQVDAAEGTHQMSVAVKTLGGKNYQYSWDFTVKS